MTNNIKLEFGQWVELNNGERHKVDARVDYLFRIDGVWFRENGVHESGSTARHVIRILPHINLPNGDVLFEGDYAKRRDGKIVGPLEYRNDPFEYFAADGWYYNSRAKNGYEGRGDGYPDRDLIACADPPEAETQDEPRLWRDMTDVEKGALLLAEHEGHEVQKFDATVDGMAWSKKSRKKKYDPYLAYRIKPADPVRETVVLYTRLPESKHQWINDQMDGDTHRITLPLIDGKMPTGTFTNEGGETIVVEELE